MSRARELITGILTNALEDGLDDEVDLGRVVNELMMVVQDTVARGFERVAKELDPDHKNCDPLCRTAAMLRTWAAEARADHR
jgi:hypothetical protein